MSNVSLAQFNRNDVEILQDEVVFQGYFRIRELTLRHRLYQGGWGTPVTREIFERGHASVLLPYDPVRDEVVLIEQFRPGTLETSDKPWLVEVVAGIIEPGESAEAVARREAEEEAGLIVGRCNYLFDYFVSPGGTSESISLFVGEVDASQASGFHGLENEGEDIRVFSVPRQQAFEWIAQGKISNASSIIALQWLQLQHQQIQTDWNASGCEKNSTTIR